MTAAAVMPWLVAELCGYINVLLRVYHYSQVPL